MSEYGISSIEYEKIPAVLYGNPSPPEYGCDYFVVEAENVPDAKKKFIRKLRENSNTIVDEYPDSNPFGLIDSVVRIEDLPTEEDVEECSREELEEMAKEARIE